VKKANRKRRTTIAWANRNHTGWWIASYIQRFEFYDEDRTNPNRRCLAWENTILVRATSREVAYRKAIKVGQLESGSEMWTDSGRRGAWRFEGLTGLLPVYDPLEDGAELYWREFENVSVRKVKGRIRSKKRLPVFDDSVGPPSNQPSQSDQRSGRSAPSRARR
jgi:hypothetical protein